MSERQTLLKKLSGAQFAALEMQLYLDTHKHDHTAFARMQEYLREAAEYRKIYEGKYGPLAARDIFGDTSFEWLNAPWPWEHESEANK